MDYKSFLTDRALRLGPSPIRALVPMMRLPGMISFGGGYPHADTFAFDNITYGFKSGQNARLEAEELISSTQYGPSDCLPALLEHLVGWHAFKDDVQLGKENLIVLNGSQEGLHILAYLLLEEGDSVALSEPAYPGALGAFSAFTSQFLTFPIDDQGSRIDVLAEKLSNLKAQGKPLPKIIYEVPNGHNPGGVGMSLERRKQLLDVAKRFDLIILEDDPYELLQLEEREPLPTLQSMDEDGRVVRLDSFSKIFAPGLRLGYASGPVDLIQRCLYYKQGSNLHTSALSQMALTSFFKHHSFEAFRSIIKENCALYRANRDAMLEAVNEYFPSSVRYNIPTEGMFIWFEAPQDMDLSTIVKDQAQKAGVLAVPGNAFSPTGQLKNCMRVSFSMVKAQDIREGIRRLANLLS